LALEPALEGDLPGRVLDLERPSSQQDSGQRDDRTVGRHEHQFDGCVRRAFKFQHQLPARDGAIANDPALVSVSNQQLRVVG
jgi:hypothetical protein